MIVQFCFVVVTVSVSRLCQCEWSVSRWYCDAGMQVFYVEVAQLVPSQSHFRRSSTMTLNSKYSYIQKICPNCLVQTWLIFLLMSNVGHLEDDLFG